MRPRYLLRSRITKRNKNTTRTEQGQPRNPGFPRPEPQRHGPDTECLLLQRKALLQRLLGWPPVCNLADAVAKRYCPWPKGLRTDSLPWFDSPLVQGASRLRYTDKAQMQRPGHTGRKALATKKWPPVCNLLSQREKSFMRLLRWITLDFFSAFCVRVWHSSDVLLFSISSLMFRETRTSHEFGATAVSWWKFYLPNVTCFVYSRIKNTAILIRVSASAVVLPMALESNTDNY